MFVYLGIFTQATVEFGLINMDKSNQTESKSKDFLNFMYIIDFQYYYDSQTLGDH